MSSILTLELFGQVRRYLNLMASHELRSVGMGFKQAVIMNYLTKNGNCSLICLARATTTDPAATTRAVDSLVKQGWIKRHEDVDDRRKWLLSLTPEGMKQTRPVSKIFEKLADKLEASLTTKEIQQLRKTLEKMASSLAQDMGPCDFNERREKT